MKHNKIMITVLCVILLSGCERGQDLSSASPSASPLESPSALPSANISTEKTSFPPLVENDPLLDLSPEEFEIEYAKLLDDYVIKIENKFATDSLCFDEGEEEPFDFGESRIITKKQAETINYISPYYKEEYFGGEMSLKGFRYFRNVKNIAFTECKLSDIDELSYLNNLESLYFGSCSFELGKTTKTLRYLLISKGITELFVSDCGLTNLDFLRGISDFSGRILGFGGNQITNITALSNLTKIDTLRLYDNRITDITPLSNLKEVNQLSLSDNPITDISPLEKLKFVGYRPYIELNKLDVDYNLVKKMFGDYLREEDNPGN